MTLQFVENDKTYNLQLKTSYFKIIYQLYIVELRKRCDIIDSSIQRHQTQVQTPDWTSSQNEKI